MKTLPDAAMEPGTFFQVHAEAILRLCRRITGNDSDAEDARQETYLQLQRNIGRLDPRLNPQGWLFRTAIHEAIKILRKRRRSIPLQPGVGGAEPVDRGEVDLVAREIEALPDEYRQVLMERFRHDRSPIEIAERMGLPRGLVRVRLCRALKTLRERLGRNP